MMGFFTSQETQELYTPRCEQCGLYKICNSPRMKPSGEGQLKCLVIGEAPGEVEDTRNTQFVGLAGQHLREILVNANIDLDKHCRKINAVNCRPPSNREPTDNEIECCRGKIIKEIRLNKPRTIILMGKSAIKSVIGPLYKDTTAVGAVSSWVDRVIPNHEYTTWLLPTYHPSFAMRNNNDVLLKWSILKAFIKAKAIANKNVWEPKKETPNVEIITMDQMAKYLFSIRHGAAKRTHTFDYETSGLKPEREGHFIRSLSVSNGHNTYASPFDIKHDELRQQLKIFLTTKSARKAAANMKFEHRWSKAILDADVKGWVWDTMLAQHYLDNRKGTTSLKFQTYVRWGVPHYGVGLERFLESESEFNTIQDAPLNDLLYYNGLDSYWEHRLMQQQIREVLALQEQTSGPITSRYFIQLKKACEKGDFE